VSFSLQSEQLGPGRQHVSVFIVKSWDVTAEGAPLERTKINFPFTLSDTRYGDDAMVKRVEPSKQDRYLDDLVSLPK